MAQVPNWLPTPASLAPPPQLPTLGIPGMVPGMGQDIPSTRMPWETLPQIMLEELTPYLALQRIAQSGNNPRPEDVFEAALATSGVGRAVPNPGHLGTGGGKLPPLWHASDKAFDKFDKSKIGSRIGTAFGWGHYLTDSKDVGIGYLPRNYSSDKRIPGYRGDHNGWLYKVRADIAPNEVFDLNKITANQPGDVQDALFLAGLIRPDFKSLKSDASQIAEHFLSTKPAGNPYGPNLATQIKDAASIKDLFRPLRDSGARFSLTDMLQPKWDRLNAVAAYPDDTGLDNMWRWLALNKSETADKQLSDMLSSMGVKAYKYDDGVWTGDATPPANYVVNDDDRLTILQRIAGEMLTGYR